MESGIRRFRVNDADEMLEAKTARGIVWEMQARCFFDREKDEAEFCRLVLQRGADYARRPALERLRLRMIRRPSPELVIAKLVEWNLITEEG